MSEIILAIVLEVVKCMVPPCERRIRHLRSYNNNIEILKKETDEITGDRTSLQLRIEEAQTQGEVIEARVDKWLESVNNAVVEAEELLGIRAATTNNRCLMGLCPNLKARLQLSKDAVRQLEAISKLREVWRSFDRVSYRPIPEDVQLLPSKDYESLESRMSTLIDVLAALEDPAVNMLGIYGMGGVGKTTLAKEVVGQVKHKYDQIIFVKVSQSQDVRKIQEEISDKLGMNLHENSEPGRASSLYNRLKNEKRILIILDDIWDNLNLQDVGIPHGDNHNGCKVLLTARSLDVLFRKMDSKRNFLIGALEQEEAWRLFKKMAGDYIEGDEFKSVATEVAKKCAGLPVSIVTMARALRNRKKFEWEDALVQLSNPSSDDFQDIQSDAYSAIKLSYDKLENEKLKKLFLLIAYANLESMDDLLMYGLGLDLFGVVNHKGKTRDRARTLVSKLKDSCMLLHHISNDEERFSIHDVVRGVAMSIASKEQNVLTVTNGELVDRWESSDTVKSYTSMLLLDVEIDSMPLEVLDCPRLEFLYIRRAKRWDSSLTIPENFFMKMKQVKVLNLTHMRLLVLPSSLGLLTNLRTLCLYDCKLQDIALVGNFKKLEILCLVGSAIQQLPEEVGELTQLKVLDLRGSQILQVIPSNVLSKLSRLEELYIDGFMYKLNKGGEEVEGLSFDELKHLPNLNILKLKIGDVSILPRGFFFQNVEEFDIRIRPNWSYWPSHMPWEPRDSKHYSRRFHLLLNTKICLEDVLIVQLKEVEELRLFRLQDQDFKYFIHELAKVGSLQLKSLFIEGSKAQYSKIREESTMQSNEIISDDGSLFIEKVAIPNLESMYLRSINVERIWQSHLAVISCDVQNLTKLEVYDCRNLKCLFYSSILGTFVQLQILTVNRCPILEELITVDQTENKNFVFPRLQFLELRYLEKLTSFCPGDVHIEFLSLKKLIVTECPEFMEFTVKYKNSHYGLTKKISIPNMEDLSVEEKHLPWIYQLREDFLDKLKKLDVLFENNSTIIPFIDFLRRFHTLKFLYISGGKREFTAVENGLTVVIRKNDEFYDMKSILKPSSILDNLERLEMCYLECDNLINAVPSSTTFHNLTNLVLDSCNEGWIKLLTSSTAKSLVRLREMKICYCESMEEIVTDDEEDNAAKDEIIFYELKKLELYCLSSLKSFCSVNCSLKFPSLVTLVVEQCHGMKIFSGGELSTPKLHKVHLWRLSYKPDWIWEGDLNTTIQRRCLRTKEGKSIGVESSEVREL